LEELPFGEVNGDPLLVSLATGTVVANRAVVHHLSRLREQRTEHAAHRDMHQPHRVRVKVAACGSSTAATGAGGEGGWPGAELVASHGAEVEEQARGVEGLRAGRRVDELFAIGGRC
jgi:hypothetical protein